MDERTTRGVDPNVTERRARIYFGDVIEVFDAPRIRALLADVEIAFAALRAEILAQMPRPDYDSEDYDQDADVGLFIRAALFEAEREVEDLAEQVRRQIPGPERGSQAVRS